MTTKTPRRGPAGSAADTTRAPTAGTHSFARVLAGTVALAKANRGNRKGRAKTAPGATETKPSAATSKGKHRAPSTAQAKGVGLSRKGVGSGSFGHLRPIGGTAAAPPPATKPPRAATFSDKLASAQAKVGRGTANAGATATTTPPTPGTRPGGLLDKLRAAKRKLGRK